jgi:hypothetical protein
MVLGFSGRDSSVISGTSCTRYRPLWRKSSGFDRWLETLLIEFLDLRRGFSSQNVSGGG